MNTHKRRFVINLVAGIMIISLILVPSGVGYAQSLQPPQPATPFEGEIPSGDGSTSLPMFSLMSIPLIGDTYQAGADRLATLQNTDGGWDWPLDDGNPASVSPLNTVGPIGKGLSEAYLHTGDSAHREALVNAGALLLSKTNNFSPSDGYLAATLDNILGGTAYTTHVMTNFYSPLAAHTYNRNGAGTLYDTAEYVESIRTNRSGDQANMAAWDIGMGLVGAASAGADTAAWIAGVKAEIDELDGANYYDVIGLAGAVYGLAYVGEDFDPTAGQHVAASSLADLGNILASYQISSGGFAWNSGWVIVGEEATQETAYSILALDKLNRATYLSNIQIAADFLGSVQLPTGGWENYPAYGDGENNEVTAEALWGINTAYPLTEVWVCETGDCGYPDASFNTIQEAVNAVQSNGMIHVAAGTYPEINITVNKSVTIMGDPGDSSAGPGSNAPVIDGGSAYGDAFLLGNGVSNVTIQGFEIRNFVTISGGYDGVGNAISAWVGSTSNIIIQDNYFHDLGYNGVLVGNDKSSDPAKWGDHTNWLIKGNIIEDFGYIGFELTNTSNSSIEDNVIHMSTPHIGAVFSSARRSESGLIVKNNQIDGTPSTSFPVIYMYAYDLDMPNPNLDSILIEGNTIATVGTPFQVYMRNIGTGNVTNVQVHKNSLMSLKNLTTATIDATANWWGAASGPGAGAVVGDVDYDPWYVDAAMTILSDVAPTTVYVDAAYTDGSAGGHIFGYDAFATIQTGITAVAGGGTVNVAAGTYAESPNIIKPLNLVGAQYDVDVSGRTAASASEAAIQGLVTVNASDVNINGFTLTNPGQTYALSITPSSSSVAITYNIVDTVGAVGLAQNVHAIVFQNGADSVTIAHNRFNNIKAGSKSVSAIGVLDSVSTDSSIGLLIQGNAFTDIASSTKGAYGVILNNGAGVPGAQIKDNIFSGLSGGWTHAIGLEGPTPNAIVTGNIFSNLTALSSDNAAILFEKNSVGNTVMVASNQFNGAAYYGVAIHPNDLPGGSNGYNYTVVAESNWWDSASGPGVVGPGTGTLVGPNIDFTPWLCDGTDTDPAIGFQTTGYTDCNNKIEVRVNASSDDAEEGATGSMYLDSTDLELVYDEGIQKVGMRFKGLNIPVGATILNAYVQFKVDEKNTGATALTIQGQAQDNAPTFSSVKRNISNRSLTLSNIPWVPVSWTKIGQAGPNQQTPDIASVVQEIINRPGWASGNSVVIIITGTGERTAESYDGDRNGAPLLHVEFSNGPIPNRPPMANDDTATTLVDTAVVVNVAANDTDPDGNLNPTSATVTADPSNGTTTNDGLGSITYTPSLGFVGSDSFTYEVCDTEALCDTAIVTITVNPLAPVTVEVRVNASSDDAEEGAAGSMYLNSTDLELVYDEGIQKVGMRFKGLNIPVGATILNAYIQFKVDEKNTGATALTIQGQAQDNALTFSRVKRNISNRSLTLANIPWVPVSWTKIGQAGPNQQTPDIASVVQEIINRPGWASGNSVVIIITGTGERTAESYDGDRNGAPLLHVEFTAP